MIEYNAGYCERHGLSASDLNAAQQTIYYLAENMRMGKLISAEGYDHLQMAIAALSGIDITNCVNRGDVEDAVLDAARAMDLNYDQLMEYIDRIAPAKFADVDQTGGNWIARTDMESSLPDILGFYECTKCHKVMCQTIGSLHKFCPECGIKMYGEVAKG